MNMQKEQLFRNVYRLVNKTNGEPVDEKTDLASLLE